MSDPATLIDCPFCDGTTWPYERYCSFCRNEVWTKEKIDMERAAELYYEKERKDYMYRKKIGLEK